MLYRISIMGAMLSFLLACSPSPEPIEYGADGCDFCRMTIVDNQHAAELVTDKGKVYKFDAIECQVLYMRQNNDTDFSLKLVNDFTAMDGRLVAAEDCTFLISESMPSPMGANLNAFLDNATALSYQQQKSGTVYDWEELQQQLNR